MDRLECHCASCAYIMICSPGLLSDGRCFPRWHPRLANLGWLRVFDTRLTWAYSVHERATVKPSIGFYNYFNLANFDLPTSIMSGRLPGTAGTGYDQWTGPCGTPYKSRRRGNWRLHFRIAM